MTAGKLGRLNNSIEIFTYLSSLGYLPDLMSYNSLIYACAHNRRLDLAEEYFNLLQKNLHPNVYSYAALMHGYARMKDTEGARRLLEMMQREGVEPNNVVLTAGRWCVFVLYVCVYGVNVYVMYVICLSMGMCLCMCICMGMYISISVCSAHLFSMCICTMNANGCEHTISSSNFQQQWKHHRPQPSVCASWTWPVR
ncbi:hypothetical protein EON63_15780 [archaeon]|nr:MAG: hypothetical protein EON63_15780 [archaeon]